MKKLSKILKFSVLGLVLSLAACNPATGGGQGGGESTGGDSGNGGTTTTLRTTYLVLGEGGLYNGQPGQSFAHLSLDNSVEFEANVGDDLPNASVVTNSNGTVLHYWYMVDGTGHETITYTVPQADYSVLYAKYGKGTASVMRVYFKAPSSWTSANIYAWSNTEGEMAGWPGMSMAQDTTGLFYFDYDTATYDNVIFNNGSEQTADLKSPSSQDADCFVWGKGWYNEDTDVTPDGEGGNGGTGGGETTGETMRVYFKSPSNWFKAYIYMWNTSSQSPYAAWPGTAMNLDSEKGLWYFEYDTTYYNGVIFNNGSGTQTADLTSPTSEDADCYVWNVGWFNEDTTEVPSDGTTGGGTTGGGSTEEKALYFIPNTEWKSDGARFAAYFFGNGDTWVSCVDSNGDGVYELTAPAGYGNIIFVRLNGGNQVNSWDNKWNQTADLAVPANENNCFRLTSGTWDNDTGSWSTYAG